MMGLVALEEEEEKFLSFSMHCTETRPCEDTVRGPPSICKPGRELSPGTELVSSLILDLPAFRTVRNFGCFGYLVHGILG